MANGHPTYWGKSDFRKHYFTKTLKIYSDKVSKFICECNKATANEVVNRISRIFDHILVDEVQDLAGYDLELIKLFFELPSSVLLVGDPRQVTYLTHHSTKFGKYSDGRIKSFVEKELKKRIECEIDEKTLNVSHRNNKSICDYSSKLYPSLPIPKACDCKECRNSATDHEGMFLVTRNDVDKYLSRFKPMQLRWSVAATVDARYPSLNFGESKGKAFERVLIYPTTNMVKWIRNSNHQLRNETRAKLYVGITRARRSAAIVIDYDDNDNIEGAEKYSIAV